MLEHRQHPRIRSFLRGEISHSGGSISIECTVRDLSADGARLQVPQSVPLPDTFELRVIQRQMCERCTMVWRRGDEVGVHFMSEQAHPPEGHAISASTGPVNERSLPLKVQNLEEEIVHLKRQLAEIRNILRRLVKEQG
jgi:hypothetical protein